ncbi:MAG TPA: hypothetical protein VMS65_13455, partial [Polyangiaceae bacterium]|nr:hypothetical protein [Polyangiaceae bacterium]
PSSTPVSVIHSYTAGGRREWSREYAGSLSAETWADDGSVLAAFAGQSAPCSLRAFDAATGDMKWERTLDLEVVDASYCLPRELSVTKRGALLWTNGPSDTLAGIAPTTGIPFWTKEPEDFDGALPSSFAGLAPRDFGLVVRYRISERRGSETDPVLLGVDPKSGNAVRLATFEESTPGMMASGPSMGGHVWGRNALLVTGSFYGSLRVFDMDASTGPRYDTTCRSIDPGFYVGPNPPPQPKPRFAPAPWRGQPRIICPELTYASRRRTYESTLFVARFPVSSFARTP